ncbi:hypothetical protein QBC47DRAFT_294018, partial [Echria macrotheca]
MYRARPFWALLALLAASTWAQDDAQGDATGDAAQTDECSCTGLDYTNGGSYLIDGNSEASFTFTSEFDGNCFDASIVPILISPEGYGYTCSAIQSSLVRVEQVSTCNIGYADMNDGSWAIVIQSPDQGFVVQREFNLTAGGVATTVVVTTTWISETETYYADPEVVTGDCYSDTDTVFQYIPGPTTYFESTITRWSTVGAQTQYYQTTITQWAYCHWP